MGKIMDISPIKQNRNYAYLYAGQFISLIGTMMAGVAMPYQIYHITQSTLRVGLLSFVQLLPLLVAALIGGVFADRHNRLKLVIYSELLLLFGSVLLAINANLTVPRLGPIYIIAALMSTLTGLHRPAFESMTQQIVSPKHFKAVGALSSFKFGFCVITGPAIAGILIANYGVVFAYYIDAGSFLFSLINLFMMQKIPKPEVKEGVSVFAALQEGIHFAWNRHELLGSYCVDIVAMIFAMPNALFPAIAQSYDGAKTLGFLYAAPAIGELFMSFFSGWTANIKHEGRAIAIAAGFWGLAMVGFGLSRSIFFALLFLALAGAFDSISGIFRSMLWNSTIPQNFRGRLAGIEMISYLSGPRLGDMRSGILASCIGIAPTIISGGILCVLGVTLCCFYMPKFWQYSSAQKDHSLRS